MNKEQVAKFVYNVTGCKDPLDLILRSGAVTRYHTEAGMRPQTNAEHCWRVAAIAHHLWPDHPQLIMAAMFHEVAEGVLGDIPAPIKRLPKFSDAICPLEDIIDFWAFDGILLSSRLDHVKMKICDYLELILTAREQIATSIGATRIIEVGTTYIHDLVEQLPCPEEREAVYKLLYRFKGGEIHHEDKTGQDHPFGFDPAVDV